MGWIGLYWVRLCTCIAEERITEMFSPEISVHLPSKKVGTVYTSHPSSQPPYIHHIFRVMHPRGHAVLLRLGGGGPRVRRSAAQRYICCYRVYPTPAPLHILKLNILWVFRRHQQFIRAHPCCLALAQQAVARSAS